MIIGQTSDPWFWVALLAIATIIGLVWAINRDRWFVTIASAQSQSMRDVDRTIQTSADTISMSLRGVTDALRSVERQVERSEELSDGHRRELIQLVVEVERRLTDAMRDWMSRIAHTSIVNQVSSGHGAANQAGENRA